MPSATEAPERPPAISRRSSLIAKVLQATSATPVSVVQAPSAPSGALPVSAPSFGQHARQQCSRPPSIVTSRTPNVGQLRTKVQVGHPLPRPGGPSFLQPDASNMLATISRCAPSPKKKSNQTAVDLDVSMTKSPRDPAPPSSSVPPASSDIGLSTVQDPRPGSATAALATAAVTAPLEREIERLRVENRFRQVAFDQLATKHQTLVLRSANSCSQGTNTDCTSHVAQGTNTDVDFEREMAKLTTKIAAFQLLQDVDRDLIKSIRRDHASQVSDMSAAKGQLESQLKEAQQSLHATQLERSTAQQQVRDMAAALASSQAANMTLTNDLAELEAQHKDEKHAHSVSLRQHESKEIDAKATENRLVEEYTMLERHYDDLKQQHERSLQTIRDLERAASTLHFDVARLTIDLEAQRHAYSQAQTDNNTLQAKFQASVTAHEGACAKMTAMHEEAERQCRFIAQLRQAQHADKEIAASLSEQLRNSQAAKSAVEAAGERQCQEWDAERTGTKERMGILEDTIEGLQMANQAWQVKYEAIHCHVGEMTSQLEALQSHCTDVLAASDDANARSARDMEQLARTNVDLHDALVALTTQHEANCMHYDLAVKRIDDLERIGEENTVKLKRAACHREMVSRSLAQLTSQWAQTVESTCLQLRTDLEAAQAANDARNAELREKEDALQTATALNNELTKRCEALEAQCRVADALKESCNELLAKCDGQDAWFDAVDKAPPPLPPATTAVQFAMEGPAELPSPVVGGQLSSAGKKSKAGEVGGSDGAIVAVVVGAYRVQAGLVSDQEDGWALPTLQWKVDQNLCEVIATAPSPSNVFSRRHSLMIARQRHDGPKTTAPFWTNVFHHLGIRSPRGVDKIVVVHPCGWSDADEGSVVHQLLDELCVANVLVTSTAQMALKAAGMSTGLVVEFCVDATYLVPIFDNSIVAHAVVQVNVGEKTLVDRTASLVRAASPAFAALAPADQTHVASNLVQRHGRVRYDIEPTQPMTIEMSGPDSPTPLSLTLDGELHLGAEVYFEDPSMDGTVPAALLASLDQCDPMYMDTFCGSVVLTGAIAKLPGLKRRLVKEVVLARPELLGQLFVDVPESTDLQPYWGACTHAKYAGDDEWARRESA